MWDINGWSLIERIGIGVLAALLVAFSAGIVGAICFCNSSSNGAVYFWLFVVILPIGTVVALLFGIGLMPR